MSEQATNSLFSRPSNSFTMDGARSVLEQTGSAEHFKHQLDAIEEAVNLRPPIAFDLAKTLVETICKTILADLGQTPDSQWDCPRLFKETVMKLQLVTGEHDGSIEASRSIKKTLGGLSTAVHGLCELRTREGMASHGRMAFATSLEPVQAELAARAADAIVSFLWGVHKSAKPIDRKLTLKFADNEGYNDWIDDWNPGEIVIFDINYRPSEVLFFVDQEAYKDFFDHFQEQQKPDDTGDKPLDASGNGKAE